MNQSGRIQRDEAAERRGGAFTLLSVTVRIILEREIDLLTADNDTSGLKSENHCSSLVHWLALQGRFNVFRETVIVYSQADLEPYGRKYSSRQHYHTLCPYVYLSIVSCLIH